jgi:hypothetical protein
MFDAKCPIGVLGIVGVQRNVARAKEFHQAGRIGRQKHSFQDSYMVTSQDYRTLQGNVFFPPDFQAGEQPEKQARKKEHHLADHHSAGIFDLHLFWLIILFQ